RPGRATPRTALRAYVKRSTIGAAMGTPTPKAIDSPAEPVVWTMLFSRIVARRMRVMAEKARKREIERPAMGIEAETVMPTFSTKYIDEAEKMMPRMVPVRTAGQVNSGTLVAFGEMKGSW